MPLEGDTTRRLVSVKVSRSVGTPQPARSDERDIDPSCQVDVAPLIPAGDYEVGFVRAEEKKMWGRSRAFLHFRIVETGQHFGLVLFMAVTLPANGRFSLSSKYLQQWALAAGKRPSRLDRLTTRVFRNKIFLGRVRTVTQDHDGKEREPTWHYSVVDCLLELRAGA
jgi:hypothetical protein